MFSLLCLPGKSQYIQAILEHLVDDNQIKSLYFNENRTSFDAEHSYIVVTDLLFTDHGHRLDHSSTLADIP